jgi:hypothetical protein
MQYQAAPSPAPGTAFVANARSMQYQAAPSPASGTAFIADARPMQYQGGACRRDQAANGSNVLATIHIEKYCADAP